MVQPRNTRKEGGEDPWLRTSPPGWFVDLGSASVLRVRMEDLTVIGNRIEAVLWFLFSVGFLIRFCRTLGGHRRLAGILALAFLVFGVSDLIEAQTGAWWRPLWLLLLKTGCLAVFAYGLFEHLRLRRRDRDAGGGPKWQ